MQSSRRTVKGGCSRSASSGQAPVSSFTGTKLWARRGKPLSWLNTERNWCSSGNWVSQSLWSQNQPASISIHHLLLLHQWVSKPLSSVSMFYTLHPLTESGSRRQACSCTEETSRKRVSLPIWDAAPWPAMKMVWAMWEKTLSILNQPQQAFMGLRYKPWSW